MEIDSNLLSYSIIGVLAGILWHTSVYRKKYLRFWYGKNGANKTLFSFK